MSEEAEVPAEEDEKGLFWEDHAYISGVESGYINYHIDTVMEMFKHSRFYNQDSLNGAIDFEIKTKTQEQLNQSIPRLLETFSGREYVPLHAHYTPNPQQNLFVISRDWRTATGVAEKPKRQLTGVFYVYDKRLYPSFTLNEILQTYLVDSMYYYGKAMKNMSKFTQFDAVKSYEWNKSYNETKEEGPDTVKDFQKTGTANIDHMNSLLRTWGQKYDVSPPNIQPHPNTPGPATPRPSTPRPPTPTPNPNTTTTTTTTTTHGRKRTASNNDLDDQSLAKKARLTNGNGV